MDIQFLLDRIVLEAKCRDRVIIAIAGAPGSGKSTLASQLVVQLTSIFGLPAALFPMDGFHLDNKILAARGLMARKGAPQTFDVAGFRDTLARIRKGGEDITIPVFDRDRDAVVPDTHQIDQSVRIVVVEGNYLLLEEDPWRELAPLFDLSVYLDVDEAVLEDRLIQRWLDQGMDLSKARDRALSNDMANARLVTERSTPADIVLDTEE